MEKLHTIPLFLVIATLSFAFFYGKFTSKSVSTNLVCSVLLVLCSVGIIAGSHVHGHCHSFGWLDPCFGYAATLIGVAAKLVRSDVKAKA